MYMESRTVKDELQVDVTSCRDDINTFIEDYLQRIDATKNAYITEDYHKLMEIFPESETAMLAKASDNQIYWTFPEVDHYIGRFVYPGVSYGKSSGHNNFNYVEIAIESDGLIYGQCLNVAVIKTYVNDTDYTQNAICVIDSKNQIIAAPTIVADYFTRINGGGAYPTIPEAYLAEILLNDFKIMTSGENTYLVYSTTTNTGWKVIGLVNIIKIGWMYGKLWMANTFIVFLFSLLIWWVYTKINEKGWLGSGFKLSQQGRL